MGGVGRGGTQYSVQMEAAQQKPQNVSDAWVPTMKMKEVPRVLC